MSPTFSVRVLQFTELREIEGARAIADFAGLLEAMEYDDVSGSSDAELRELCVMALQELPPGEAAEVVLQFDLGSRLKPGLIQNMAHSMADEKLWEQSADLSLHERLFSVGSLLYEAQPTNFPKPDAVRVRLELSASNDAGRALLARPLAESFLVRLLADGMDDRAILRRLFEDQLAGDSFPEAENIVWIVHTTPIDAATATVEVTSSGAWLDPLRGTQRFESSARPDADD